LWFSYYFFTMLKVKDIMTRDIVTVRPETEIVEAARILMENHFNGVPVVDEAGKLVGILCQSDLIAQQKRFPMPSIFSFADGYFPLKSMKHLEEEIHKFAAAVVADAMGSHPVTVTPETDIEEVATLMVDRKLHTLPVIDDEGNLVGIIGKKDVLQTLITSEK